MTVQLAPIVLDGPAIAVDLQIPASTIRRWFMVGLLTDHGKDTRGRRLFSYDEVERLAYGDDTPTRSDEVVGSREVTRVNT